MSSLLIKTLSTRRLAALPSSSWRATTAVALPPPAPFAPTTGGTSTRIPVRTGHTVRIILQDDLPNGKGYAGDVVHVKAGYARNYLIPQKMALYATRANFARLNMKDPDMETVEEKLARLERERLESEDEDLKAYDLLAKYLHNKVLKIWRNVDPLTEIMRPGMVDAKAIRYKLSKQLRIDLEPHEAVHLYAEPQAFVELTEAQIDDIINKQLGDASEPCKVQVKELGEYIARISLQGGFMVPLKVDIRRR